MNLRDFKAQNPAYKDVPDNVLADALYKKHYSNISRPDFDRQIGLGPPQSGLENLTGGFNRAITGAIGGLVDVPRDVANYGLRQLDRGLEDIGIGGTGYQFPVPFEGQGATGSLRSGLGELGIGTDYDEDSLLGLTGEFAGLGATFFAPLAGKAKSGTEFVGRVTKYLNPILDFIRRRPGTAFATDLAVSPPGAAGTKYGGEFGGQIGESLGGERGRRFGESMGATVGGLAGVGVPVATAATVVGAGRKAANVLGLTARARHQKAADIIRKNAGRSTEELTYLEEKYPAYGEPTTGEYLNDPGLISLQRAMERRGSGAGLARGKEVESIQNQSLRRGLSGFEAGATAEERRGAVGFFQARVQGTVRRIEGRIRGALRNAATKVARLDPDADITAVQKTARENLDKALKEGRADERKLWQGVGVERYDVTGVRERATKIINETPKTENVNDTHPLIYQLANKEKIKEVPTGLLDEYGVEVTQQQIVNKSLLNDQEPIGVILAARSRMLEAQRAERARGNYKRARKIGLVVDSLFDDVIPLNVEGAAVMERVDAARKFSKSFHDTFTKGPVGEILGYKASGDLRTAPEKTLETLLRPGTDGLLGYRALRQSVERKPGGVETIDAHVEDFLKNKFASAAIDATGKFNPQAANSFVRQNELLLDQFPQLRQQMMDAGNAERLARSMEKSGVRRVKKAEAETHAAKYTQGEPAAQMRTALDSRSPRQAVKSLLNAARKDPTGVAEKGVKGAFYDEMMRRVAPDSRAVLDEAGEAFVQAKRLRQFLRDHGGVVREIYGNDGVRLLREISRGANMAARIGRGVAAGGGSDTSQNISTIAGNLGAIIGAKLGARTGTHELIASGIGRRHFMGFIDKIFGSETEKIMSLVEEALYNPKFARALLGNTSGLPVVSKTARDRARITGGRPGMGVGRFAVLQELMDSTLAEGP